MNRNRLYILVLVSAFGLLLAAEYFAPKPLNWARSYSQNDKIPYGNYVIFSLLENIFPNQTIINHQQTLYEYSLDDRLEGENFIFINDRFQTDKLESEPLMRQVFEEGSHVWIAAENFRGTLADTFKIKTDNKIFFGGFSEKDSMELYFIDKKLNKTTPYRYTQEAVSSYFSLQKTKNYEVLSRNSQDSVVLIRIRHGKGAFYFHSCPLVFTNYHVLSQNHSEYIAAAWSHLPVRPVVWDEYQKVGRAGARTPLRYILSVEALRGAWLLGLLGLLIYTLFYAKRRQKAIPIIRPPQNDSLDFVRTLGSLYFQRADHKNLAEKKIQYFYEYLRNQYYMYETPLSEAWKEKLLAKTQAASQDLENLVELIKYVQKAEKIDESSLQNLVKLTRKITS